MGAGLRPGAKATEQPPDPTTGAPVLDSTVRGWEWPAMRGERPAQAMEARRVETSAAWLDAQHESAVPKGCARMHMDTGAGPWRQGQHRRRSEPVRRMSGGAAAERGARSATRDAKVVVAAVAVSDQKGGRAAGVATRPVVAMRVRRRSAAPGCRARRLCRRGCR